MPHVVKTVFAVAHVVKTQFLVCLILPHLVKTQFLLLLMWLKHPCCCADEREHVYVPGSGQAKLQVVGDTVGPVLYTDNLNAETLLRRGYGAGETSFYNFAYILWSMRFERAASQLTTETLLKVNSKAVSILRNSIQLYNGKCQSCVIMTTKIRL